MQTLDKMHSKSRVELEQRVFKNREELGHELVYRTEIFYLKWNCLNRAFEQKASCS